MPILNFDDLKDNKTFIKLLKIQSEFNEKSIHSAQIFTYSFLQIMPFLMIYAGLSHHHRSEIFPRLCLPNLNKTQVDKLVTAINWKYLLQNHYGPMFVRYIFEVPNKNGFLETIKKYCPQLFEAIEQNPMMIEVTETPHIQVLNLITEIQQNEVWLKSFEYLPPLWLVSHFKLSKKLENTIKKLTATAKIELGNFTIFKGTNEDIRLCILKPLEEAFSMEKTFEIEQGFHSGLEGLVNIWGAKQIHLQLKITASFSATGTLIRPGDTIHVYDEPIYQPTVIIVNKLNLFFHGIDVFANFKEPLDGHCVQKRNYFDNDLYIELLTISPENTHAILFTGAPTIKQAFELTCKISATKEGFALGQTTEKSASKLFHSLFKVKSKESNEEEEAEEENTSLTGDSARAY